MESLALPLDHAAIEKILPHRYPFLLVDRITGIEVDKRIVDQERVESNDGITTAQMAAECCHHDPDRSDRSSRRYHDSGKA